MNALKLKKRTGNYSSSEIQGFNREMSAITLGVGSDFFDQCVVSSYMSLSLPNRIILFYFCFCFCCVFIFMCFNLFNKKIRKLQHEGMRDVRRDAGVYRTG